MVSDVNENYETPIKINQYANLYVTEVDANSISTITISNKRQAYFLLIEGDASLTLKHHKNNQQEEEQEVISFNLYDAAEIFGPCSIDFTPIGSSSSAHGLLIEMAFTGPGREDL